VTGPDLSNEPAAPSGNGGFVRLRLDLSYDGTDFFGWASQPGLRTVQQVLEAALTTVLRLDPPARLVVAGRTDSGVHALGQVAHVDVPVVDDLPMLTRRIAGIAGYDVGIRAITLAPPGFNARFSAIGRRYVFRANDRARNPLRRRDTVDWSRPLDVDAMNEAALGLLGQHDFAAYCRPREGATTIRTLLGLEASRDAESTVLVEAYADAFCRHQVRSMVGALLSVGDGRRTIGWPTEMLNGRVRSHTVNVAAAKGLTLVAVDYPPDSELAARAELTRQRRAGTPRSP
jgi:tRNA pseudouridine38-40 synthase